MENQEIKCSYCAFVGYSVEELFEHQCPEYDAEVCLPFSATKFDLHSNKDVLHNQNYCCLSCDFIADNSETLKAHNCNQYNASEWNTFQDDIINMICAKCSYKATDIGDWITHVCVIQNMIADNTAINETLLTCENCGFKSFNTIFFESHECTKKVDDEWWHCSSCNFGTVSLETFLHHKCTPISNETEYKCSKCTFVTRSDRDYILHNCDTSKKHSLDEPCTSNCNHQDNHCSTIPGRGQKRKNAEEHDALLNISKKRYSKSNYRCPSCGRGFVRENAFLSHSEWCKNRMVIESIHLDGDIGKLRKVASAFNKFVTYENADIESIDIESLQMSTIEDLTQLINQYLQIYNCLKFELIVDATLTHPISTDVSSRRCFHSIMHSVLRGDDIQNTVTKAFSEIKELVDQHTERGSGWTLNTIKSLQINIGKYVPHRGGCSQFALPIEIMNKKCLISINTQDSCFLYSVLAALHPFAKNAQRKSNYTTYINRYDTTDLPCDGMVDLFQAEKFAKRNNLNLNIYTYDVDEKCVIPLKIMAGQNDEPILLFLYDDHYYKITNFDRFASCKNKHSRRHCFRCLSAFTSTDALEKHKDDCFNLQPQRISLPNPHNNSSKFSFYRYQNEIMHPYVVYADFETLSVTNEDEYRVRTLPVCSYGYVAVDWEGNIIVKDFYRGVSSGEKFLESILEAKRRLDTDLASRSKPLNMTDEDEFDFTNAKKCFICSNPLQANRVRDHDHLTGKYRGAAHNECNLKYRLPSKLPIFFHNLKNFDAHIIFRALTEPIASDIFIIPHTMEKYIAFTFKDFIFLDSFAFLPSSLEKLAENITSDYKAKYLKQIFNGDVELLMKKAALPYEYIDSYDRFKETSLPEIDKFYSSLKEANISDEMYSHLKNIWTQFYCETLGDFHDIYLKVDVLLLAAVFENFRKVSHDNFKLDPCHNFSIPGLSMNAALRYTRAKAGLITDIDMLLLVEKDIRGGLTVVSKRYCKTEHGVNEIVYLDVNNLYGYAMSQPLPYDGFAWVDMKDQNIDQLLAMCKNGIGMIFEVDLLYPDHLHDAHNDYPLAPHKMEVNEEMHSTYQKELLKRLKERNLLPSSSKKLLSTFYPREKYVVHHKLLKYYIDKGLIVTKIHRAFKFRERAWLQPYVEFCTKQRQAATNSFDKDIWKLNVNSIYGKTIEDKRKHRRVQLVFKENIALKRLRSELCESFTIIGEDKMLFQLKKGNVYMDKPVSVGFAVLELAKLKMFELHYDHFKARLGNDIELLYTDTDSLIYNIKTNVGSDILKEFSDIMDFSNYPQDHHLFSNKNEKAIGFIKDEMGGKRIEEFIALKPKLYAIKTIDGEKKKAKGIQKNTVNKTITFKQYEECLWQEIIPVANQQRLQSKEHVINMVKNKKIVMTPFDDKRYLLEDGVSTLAYGHFVTKQSF